MNTPLSTEHVGARTAFALKAFAGHFGREPTDHVADTRWITGYVAALEDLPHKLLSSLDLL